VCADGSRAPATSGCTIGKLSDLKKEERVGWEEIGRILSGEPAKAEDLFEKQDDGPEWAEKANGCYLLRTNLTEEDPAKLLQEFREIRSMDIVMPVKDHNPVRLRIVAKPDEHVRVLLQRLEIKIPNRPKMIENAVKTLTPEILQTVENKQSLFYN